MSNQDQVNQDNDYLSAMRILAELCIRHDVECTEKIRGLFWRGVILGKNRAAAGNAAPGEIPVGVTEKEPPPNQRTFHRDMAHELPDPAGSNKSGLNELGEAVSFRL